MRADLGGLSGLHPTRDSIVNCWNQNQVHGFKTAAEGKKKA